MRRITERDRESNLPPKSSIFSCSSMDMDMDMALTNFFFGFQNSASTPTEKR